MAFNDRQILDVVSVALGTEGTSAGSLTDISGYLSKAELVVTNNVVTTPATFGQNVVVRDVSETYDWSVMLNILTDGYGANTIDQIVTQIMRAPLGPTTTSGVAEILMKATTASVSASNPSYAGKVVIGEWRPLGGGEKTTAVQNSVTWMGGGILTVTRS